MEELDGVKQNLFNKFIPQTRIQSTYPCLGATLDTRGMAGEQDRGGACILGGSGLAGEMGHK